ncbi:MULTISPECIES: branched-chain amino acid transporter permease [Corynebacterium]|uniref:branched-chain amino acid transporter permease n=1 Tax=Corynebacterium TaxID=1716 RepID=UPI00254BFC0C|nr:MULTISPECIES: AzlD domain-containing protein [Corynebacterium]MDK6260749.1 AzlD domain-containing protein [Corynebacterium frankenforstense]MDK8895413.1 AzlD domain-containing protein [Corynebacterium sp. MSK006]
MLDFHVAGLPADVTLGMVLAVLIPVGVVTVLIRQAPYSARKLLKNNYFVGTLALTMPVGVMVVLVVYTLVGQAEAPGGLLASGIALAVTVGLHAWRRDSGLSILGGTATYMILVNLVF